MRKAIQKLLIANRGEIAVRIMKTCKTMGISTVAVFSDADQHSFFLEQADEAVWIGASPSRESYLNQDKIIAAAKKTNADAVHPGYGFLSENAEFATRCAAEGIVFVGPSPQSMALMSSKVAARQLVASLNLPVIPGDEELPSGQAFSEAAERIGFPILLKASAGGGGLGMRIVEEASQLETALVSARQEAFNAFGDDHLFLEKYLAPVKHIEFQILADQYGHVVHCGERECSIQRRRQKIIEEIPAARLSAELREKMGATAVAIAAAVGYSGAGTIEFVVEDCQEALSANTPFYFLEMNTRLQVEHGITEMVTGLDLVQWQIKIAEGAPLKLEQTEIQIFGHAIECRLYAEDPQNDFHPISGKLLHWEPPANRSIRVDSGVQSQSEIPIFYDPLLAKIMVQGETREEAVRLMTHTLKETVALGTTTNQSFLQMVLQHPAFLAGKIDTGFVESHFPAQKRHPLLNTHQRNALLAVGVVWLQLNQNRERNATAWKGATRLSRVEKLQMGSEVYEVNYFIRGDHEWELHIAAQTLHAKIGRDCQENHFAEQGTLKIQLDHLLQTFQIAQWGNQIFIHSYSIGTCKLIRQSQATTQSLSQGDDSYQTKMPVRILKILVQPHQAVVAGQKLLTMESMKMESSLVATAAGKVRQIFVTPNQLVDAGTLLLAIDPL